MSHDATYSQCSEFGLLLDLDGHNPYLYKLPQLIKRLYHPFKLWADTNLPGLFLSFSGIIHL